MLKLKNSKLRTLLLESFLIILSVMLGLLGNDLRESINKNHDAEFAIVNVKNEIRENEKELAKSIEKQKAVYKYFEKLLRKHNYFKKSKKSFYTLLRASGSGINFPLLSTSAWETAKSTGITENFDYNLLVQLTQIDEQTKWDGFLQKRILTLVYDEDVFDYQKSEHVTKAILLAISDLIQSEKALLKDYKAALKST